jgi:tRNA-2-methylthio-N6-dimethylallyladenosine synthase
MPLQSGSDSILKAMNRNYRASRYIEIIENIRAGVPDMAVTTDIIVGFPGEREEDFEATLAIMNTLRFFNSYVFMFSPRPGTEAALLEDDVPDSVKLKRLQILQARQEEIAREHLTAFEGTMTEVLIDGPGNNNDGTLMGRNPQNIPVHLVRDENHERYQQLAPGMLVQARVVGRGRFSLKGEVCYSE